MSTTYTIIFQNNRGSAGQYAVFGAVPTFASTSTSPEAYSNVWISKYVAKNGNFTIQTSSDFYAWVGTAPQSPAPGVVVSGGTSALATLGTQQLPGSTFKMVIDHGTPTLEGLTYTAKPSAYEIDAGNDFPNPNSTFLIGLGKVDPNGIVSPIATTLASNGMNTQITPIMKFYIGQSSYLAGTIVDFQSVSANVATIDFSTGPGYGCYTSIVKQDNMGNWDVSYVTAARSVDAINAIGNGTLTTFLSEPNTLRDAKLAQLEAQIGTIADMLKSLSQPEALGDPSTWIGLVNWPVATAAAVIATGASLILAYLVNKGYSVSYSTSQNPDGTFTTKFKFGPSRSTVLLGLGNINDDWNDAVNADKNIDGHSNGGIKAGISSALVSSKKGAMNGLTEEKREAILNGGF